VRAPGERAASEAARVIHELGIRGPEDLDVVLIAAHHGLFARTGTLSNEEGHLLRAGRVGLATIDRGARERGDGRFVLAHELGHFLLHQGHDDFARCTMERASPARRKIETEASDFAAELLVPRGMLAERLTGRDVGLQDVAEAACHFGVTLPSMALRVLLVAGGPHAVVVSRGGRVHWWAHAAGFTARVGWGHRLDERTVASTGSGAAEVPAEAWDCEGRAGFLREEARPVDDTVLSWLHGYSTDDDLVPRPSS